MTDWNPIETAPRDGTEVLLFYPDRARKIYLGHYIDREEIQYGQSVRKTQQWYDGTLSFSTFGERSDPTHWMPLPREPEGGK